MLGLWAHTGGARMDGRTHDSHSTPDDWGHLQHFINTGDNSNWTLAFAGDIGD